MRRHDLVELAVGFCLGLMWLAGPAVLKSEEPAAPAAPAAPTAAKPVDPEHAAKMQQSTKLFQQQVGQLLRERCLKCHGGEFVEGEFNLATREGLLKGGAEGPVIEPGKAKQSRLYRLVAQTEEPYMPQEGKPLTAAELEVLVRWLDLGAAYDRPLVESQEPPISWKDKVVPAEARQVWAFRPLARSAPPAVKNETWVRTPIDRYVLAALEQRGMVPNEPADRRTLIRRATFDLLGLPPEPAEVEAFVQSSDPDAYEKLLDRLLDSPHFGERWARYWLDAARFAESHGFEQDYDRPHAYWFRDFVVWAFNQDLPYDTFVRWQLAGDEFEPDNPYANMATGFLGAGVFPTQITANEVERTRYDALDDMAATMGTAMLGLTIGCARCHDHKFDPIPQADYYRLIAHFTTTVRSNVDLNLDPEGYRRAKEAFDREHAPYVAALEKFERDELPARLAAWEQQQSADGSPLEAGWLVLDLEVKSQGGATFTRQADGSYLAGGKNADFDTYTLSAKTTLSGITALRLDALSDPSLPKGGPGRAGNGNFALTGITLTVTPAGGQPRQVELKNPQATFQQQGLPIAAALDADEKSGWAVDPQFGKDHAALFETAEPIGSGEELVLSVALHFKNNKGHNLGRIRLSVCNRPGEAKLDAVLLPALVAAALKRPAAQRSPEEAAALLQWFASRDPQWQALHRAVQEHLAKAPQPRTEKVMICSEGVTPIRHHTQGADFFNETYYLRRGECDQKDGVAQPGFLQVLHRHPEGDAAWRELPPPGWRTSYRRRSLANWITDPQHGAGHLLARVIVNRVWHHHLGRGIVATPNDFGSQGAPPTHPELLDELAAQFIEDGWRLKRLHKRIMTSAVYMQSSRFDAEDVQRDPINAYYWRFEPRRLEAEVIRDSLLAVGGLLDRRLGGPGTLDENHTRRSLYFMIKRSKLVPMMQLFDAPEPLVSVGQRPTTTIAPQALVFMNAPLVRRCAAQFASRLEPARQRSVEEALREAYRLALARDPTDDELRDGQAFLQQQTDAYQGGGKSDGAQRAWTDFCQVLLSLNEFVYVR